MTHPRKILEAQAAAKHNKENREKHIGNNGIGKNTKGKGKGKDDKKRKGNKKSKKKDNNDKIHDDNKEERDHDVRETCDNDNITTCDDKKDKEKIIKHNNVT